MHTRTPHRRKRRARLVVLLFLLAALGAGAALFFFYTPTANRTVASAAQPAGVIKAMAVRFGPDGDALTRPVTQDTLEEQAANLAAQAAVQGMNTLLLSVKEGDALLYIDRLNPVLSTLTQEGWPARRLDGLEALCQAASAQGLAVCAVVEQAQLDEGGGALMSGLERMFQKYPLLAVYVHQPAESTDALFDAYTPLLGDTPSLIGIADAGWADPTALFLYTVAQAQAGQAVDGVVFALEHIRTQSETAGLLLSTLDGATPPVLLGYTPGAALSVSYPANGASLTTATCFLMGTSDPAQPLLLNGAPVERTTEGGTFGVLVELAVGENTFVLTQGDDTVALTVTRTVASGGSSGGERPHDATVEVAPGTAVQVSGWIASLLYDPSGDGNINETVRQGAVATVQACVETVRSGKTTWAYQLASGDYILAYNTTVLGADVPRAQLTGAQARQTQRGEILTFIGSGTPLAYTNQIDNTLVLHFYDADAAADFAVEGSTLVKDAATQPLPDGAGVELVLTFDAPLWGHSVEYTDGAVELYVKTAPMRGQDPAKPLAGITVLLDAGHGADDAGAMGVAGYDAPTEKDVNLAVALAARYRLEQLGATVEMIRTDDTFLTLAERNAKISELQPDFFVAVHHNSLELTVDANAATGIECYYFYPSGKALATTLVDTLSASLNRAARGAMWGYYYVTRNTTCPAVLLEVGFMINPAEYENVTDETTLWATGDAIARSILACVPTG